MAAMGQDGDDVDHYEVLCLPSGEEGAALSVEQIEKAYRTQSRLRHPDKRPDDPNATADFQSLASSYKFLRDESLRRQFDARLRGRREAAARAAATGVKRRRAVSDLEERERAFAAGGGQYVDPDELARREDKRKAADIKRELNEFVARKNSFISGSASISAHGDKKGGTPENEAKTDNGKILKVSWEGGADYYSAAKLEEMFKQFGKVEDIVIKTRKSRNKGSAIVVMASKEAAVAGRRTRSPRAPALDQRAASSLIRATLAPTEGWAPSKMQSLRCFQTIHGTSRVADARPLRIGLGVCLLAPCHHASSEAVSWLGAGQGMQSLARISCQT